MKRTFLLSFLLALIAHSAVPAQDGARLPLDSSVIVGKLKNGLTYFIRKNGKPEKRAELRLVVRAGSVLEEPAQRGLAHVVEHMAFNGTKKFEKHEIVNFLESIGMRFGADLNAYTSFDETVYMLQLPTENPRVLDTGVQILEEWAQDISFEEDEIAKERGVVIEEWRLGRGASARIRDRQLPVLFHNSLYAERLPIGSREVLDTFKSETLRAFYRKWYRPDLMAVVAVGDFDPAMMEKMIQTHFNTVPKPQNPIDRPVIPVPDHDGTLFTIESDPETPGTVITIYHKHPYGPLATEADYRRRIIEDLFNGMLSERLSELSQHPDPPFLFAFSSTSPFGTAKDLHTLTAATVEGGIERGAEAVMTEALRVRRHGFTQSELDRRKQETLRAYEQALAESDKTESSSYANEYVAYFLEGLASPGIAYEVELHRRLIPGITLDEVNALAGKLITDRNRVVSVTMPEKEGMRRVSQSDILAAFERAAKRELEPYVDRVADRPLLANPPAPGSIVSERRIDAIGVTEWKLSNGAHVVVKPTDFRNDEVGFAAFSPGGTSLVADSEYYSASEAASIIDESGIDGFDRIELGKLLSGKVVGVSPFIADLFEGMSGSASPRDIETLLQLVHLYFTAPRIDTAAFISYVTRVKGSIQNRSVRPETALNDTLRATLSQYHPRRRPWTSATYDRIDLGDVYRIYRDRFADAGDFTFLFVGNVTPEQLRPLAERYLASLPSTGRVESWRDIGVRPPTGVIEKEVRRGVEPKSQVRLVFTGPFEWNPWNRTTLQSLIDVLEFRFREELREEKGGTYGVGAYASSVRYPIEAYTITISFGCAPDRVDELTKSALGIIERMKKDGPTAVEMEKVKEAARRQREVALKENGFWLGSLQAHYMYGEDPADIAVEGGLIERLKADDIKAAARRYFDMKNYVKVVLNPER